MSLPPEPDSIEAAPKPWKRWLPLAIAAVIAATVVVIAVASGNDSGTTSNTASTVDQSVPIGGSAATNDTSTGQVTTASSSTAVPGAGGSTTNPAASSTNVTGSTDATGSTASTAAGVVTTQGTAPASGVDLGRAADFAVLGNTAVDSTGPTTVSGQIGASNGLPTGFSSTANGPGLIIVGAQAAQQAQLDVDGATPDLDNLAPTELPAAELDTQTIGPGTYHSATLGVTGTLTLDAGGDPSALFVFQSAGTLTTAAASQSCSPAAPRRATCSGDWARQRPWAAARRSSAPRSPTTRSPWRAASMSSAGSSPATAR